MKNFIIKMWIFSYSPALTFVLGAPTTYTLFLSNPNNSEKLIYAVAIYKIYYLQ